MKIGIALSGGGLRGAAHIGVLKALEENGIFPDFISGASAGSIVAGAYASGMTIEDMEKITTTLTTRLLDPDIMSFAHSVISLILGKPVKMDGIIQGNRLEKLFCKMTHRLRIQEAKLPLAISAVDINTSKIIMFVSSRKGLTDSQDYVYLDSPFIYEAIRASIAIPVVFKPKFFNNMRLVDGGVRENIPVDILKKMGADAIIAVNLGYSGQTRKDIDNIFEIGSQTLDIMAYQIVELKTKGAELILNPHIYDVSLFDFDRADECIQRGYEETLKNISSIKKAINRN